MKKKSVALILVLLFALISVSTTGYAAGGESPSQAIVYQTEIKVKLLPAASSFSATLKGSYEIVNLDDNTLVPFNSTVKFSIEKGKVLLTSDGGSISSVKGYTINEILDLDDNEVEISKILTATGVDNARYRGSFEILPSTTAPLLFNRLGMEGYLKGVVPSEMPASWHMEALKAQAIAARSYAYTQVQSSKGKGYLEMTVASQVYGGKSKEVARSNQAIKDTEGLYATYNNKPIDAVFHSSSGGYTENSENVWSSVTPYLKAVPDPYDKHPGNYHYGWESISQASILTQKLKLSSTQILAGIKIVERGPSSGAKQMSATIYDKKTKTKSKVTFLPNYLSSPDGLRSFFGISLKSIKFNVYTNDSEIKIKMADGTEAKSDHLVGYQLQKADGSTDYIEDLNLPVRTLTESKTVKTRPNTFRFKGDGWGHLLGMSQWGARGMAEAGFTYDQIIKKYYTGVEIKNIQ